MPTDNVEKKYTRTVFNIHIDQDVAITGSNRMIDLHYNNAVEGTGRMNGVELVTRTAEKIATLRGITINALDKGKDISEMMSGLEIKMEEDTGGATIAKLNAIEINICLRSSPTYSAAIEMKSTDTYSPQYGIDMTSTNHLDPTKADLRLSRDVCIFSGAGAPTDGTTGTGAGYAGVGSIYIDRTNGALYVNTGTTASPTWKLVTQAG